MADYKGNADLPAQKRLRDVGTLALPGFMAGSRGPEVWSSFE
jgi:hypothetical protein